jgi:serine/threonine-protein kinase
MASEAEARMDDAHFDSPPAMELGKYRLFARLGEGGMAEVFLAVARGPMGFNKLFVIKRLRATQADVELQRDMFLDEARLAARLNHPNVVQTYEVCESDGSYFIVMEYLEGQPLSHVMKALRRKKELLPHTMAARLVSEALSGLHHAHELRDYDGTALNIVHRDISPQNIFVTYDGQTKLVDFGIAKADLRATKTEVGVFKGKVAYMAPEQLQSELVDRRADLFAMGIVLWELLTGERLMAAGSTPQTLFRLLNHPIPRVSEVVPDVDPALDDLVARALQRDVGERFQTALEMREALETYIASHKNVRQEEIGRLVGTMFEDVRKDVQRKIHEHVEALSSALSSGSIAAAAPLSEDRSRSVMRVREVPNITVGFGSSDSDPNGRLGSVTPGPGIPALSHAPTATSLSPGITQPASLRKKAALVGTAAAVAAVAVALFFAQGRRPADSSASASHAAPASVAKQPEADSPADTAGDRAATPNAGGVGSALDHAPAQGGASSGAAANANPSSASAPPSVTARATPPPSWNRAAARAPTKPTAAPSASAPPSVTATSAPEPPPSASADPGNAQPAAEPSARKRRYRTDL